MAKKKYYIETHFACDPFLFRSPVSQKLYAMPGWIEVPEGTKQDQLVHVKPDWLIESELNQPKLVKQFKSSKGDMTYNVYLKGKEYTCDCPGYRFRNRNCKHIKQVYDAISK